MRAFRFFGLRLASPASASPAFGGLVILFASLAFLCASVAQARDESATLRTLYQFPGGGDGLAPWGGLANVNGTLYGTTYGGGAFGRGAVYGINPVSGAETLVHSFAGGADVNTPQVGLLRLGSLLYGVASGGGSTGYGGVYQIDPATGAETVIYNFTTAMGGGSGSSLVAAGGFLYGTTFGGGSGLGYGTVFKLKISTRTATTLYSFTGGADGASPQYGVAYAQGILYGTTTSGGGGHAGTLFAVNATTGAETTLFSFDGSTHGGGPYGGVIDVGGVLYGTASYGGTSGNGVIFSYDLGGNTEKTVYAFTGGADGGGPQSTLIDLAGTFYGTTFYAGAGGYGTVFSLDLATGTETTLYSFQGGANGGHSLSPLLYAGGVLYGTDAGPESVDSHNGTVFKIVLKTKAQSALHGFVGAGPFLDPGKSELLDVGGILFGTTGKVGADHAGTVYSLDPATGAQATLYAFTGGADGGVPSGGLVADGGLLYGLDDVGGANQDGVIYSIDPAKGTESVAYSFPAGSVQPTGTLLLIKGLLYGTTHLGGSAGCGTVFSFDPAKAVFSTLYNFTCGSDGGDPSGGLSADGDTLYGTAETGGSGFYGTAFKIDIATGVETVLHNFTGAPDGAYPASAPLTVGGTLYGTTLYGGTQSADCFAGFGCGVLYSINLANGAYTLLHSFIYSVDGAVPSAGLRAVGKTLYGSTSLGGASTLGTLFSFVPARGTVDTLYTFTGGTDGSTPGAALTHVGGLLYGTTSSGATVGAGTVFSFTP